jgi:Protein of unknown function (DUF3433)
MARRPRVGVKADRRQKRWMPASLSTVSLALTFALFLSLLISLLLLKYAVNSGNGFVLLSRNPYTWVYGPTALLIIITSIWRQIDYHCKALRPWEELQKGPAPADRTLLLDLVSPLQVVSFFNSVTKSHFPVVVTISGFVILKMITIASTGLLDIATVGVGPIDATLQYTSQINNATLYSGYGRGYPINPLAIPYTVAVPYTAYAILDKDLPFSDGTTNELAHETFRLMEGVGVSNLSYSADVQVFVPKVSCDAVDFELSFKDTAPEPWYPVLVFRNDSRWSCPDLRSRHVFAENYHKTYCPPRQLQPVFGPIDCWLTKDTSERGSRRRKDYENDAYLVAIVDLYYHQTWNQSVERLVFGDPAIPASAKLEIRTINAFLCKIDYAIETRHVTYRNSTILPSISERLREVTETRQLADFTAGNLTSKLGVSFRGFIDEQGPSGTKIFQNSLASTYIPVEQPSCSIFRMMSSYVGGDYVTLLDDIEAMKIAAQDVIKLTSIQIAHELLFRSSAETLTGKMSYTIELLQMQSTSVYIMLVGFFIMATGTLIIWLTRPTLVMIDDPTTIAAHAEVLSHSRLLFACLSSLRPMEEKRAQQYLDQDRYFMQRSDENNAWFDSTISLEVGAVPAANFGSPSHTWWRPFTTSSIFLVMTMTLPLVAITLLEALQHISDRSNGFASLRQATPYLVILGYTKFLPALVMLLIATAFNCFDFNTLVLDPFRALSTTTRGSQLLVRPPAISIASNGSFQRSEDETVDFVAYFSRCLHWQRLANCRVRSLHCTRCLPYKICYLPERGFLELNLRSSPVSTQLECLCCRYS